MANAEGEYTIAPATIKVDGKEVKSNSVTIKVVKGSARPQQGQQGGGAEEAEAGTSIKKDDIFLRLEVNRKSLYVGESVVQTEYKNNYDYSDFDLNGDVLSTLGHRDSDFRARGVAVEHTYVTSGEEITKTIEQFGYDSSIEPYKSTFIDFVPYNEEPRVLTGGDATSVSVVHSAGYKTYFDWDATEGKYMMSQYSKAAGAVQPSVDANNDQQLKFDNVIVFDAIEGRIPNFFSLNDRAMMEEDARKFYVAISRAKRRLYVSYCTTRRDYHNEEHRQYLTRFMIPLQKLFD